MHLFVSWWLACSAGVFFGRANVFALESAMLKLPEERRKWGESKGAGRGRGIGGEREEKSIFSPLFQCHKIKDGGYNNTNTNMNKVSPTQNMPALRATWWPVLWLVENWPVFETRRRLVFSMARISCNKACLCLFS